MAAFDDTTLIAFTDGQLDPATHAAVKARAAVDPALRQRIVIFQDSALLLQGRFDTPLRQPVPAPLLARVKPVQRLRLFALAASLALVTGLGSGYFATLYPVTSAPVSQLTVTDPLLHQALAAVPSGGRHARAGRVITPLMTFIDKQGRYCREFEQSMIHSTKPLSTSIIGAACLTANDTSHWQLEVLLTRHLVTEVLTSPTAAASDYVPATGQDVTAFDAVLDALSGTNSTRLNAAQEQHLIDAGWHRNEHLTNSQDD